MAESKKVESIAVAIPVVAVNAAREEMNKRKENGVPMSLGAVISEAVMKNYGKGK